LKSHVIAWADCVCTLAERQSAEPQMCVTYGSATWDVERIWRSWLATHGGVVSCCYPSPRCQQQQQLPVQQLVGPKRVFAVPLPLCAARVLSDRDRPQIEIPLRSRSPSDRDTPQIEIVLRSRSPSDRERAAFATPVALGDVRNPVRCPGALICKAAVRTIADAVLAAAFVRDAANPDRETIHPACLVPPPIWHPYHFSLLLIAVQRPYRLAGWRA